VDSFLSAVHHFTGIRILRGAAHPIDAATLAWTPIVGLLAAILTISFYIPLGAFYLPTDVAVIPALVAICWLRGFKPEIDFCNLCDSFFGRRKRVFSRSLVGVPGIICLIFATLLKYVIVRQFFFLESIKLLAFGILISFVVPLFRPERAAGWIKLLGVFWLLISAIAAFSPMKILSATDFFVAWRGPVLASALIYLCVRLTFQLADEPAPPPNIAALPAELTAYLSFMLVRYHFL
jgi:hypothetical protein